MAYQVKLDVFEGPIDLLLHLITRQRVEIYDVSLSTITNEYLNAVAGMETLDLELTTGFLLVAATLLELKSNRLLPSPVGEGSDLELLEERDLLLARLIECSTFREAGAWIAAALEEGAAYHGREVALEAQFLDVSPDLLQKVTPARLARAAGRALATKPVPVLDTSHLTPIRVSVRDAIAEVGDRLQRAGTLSFEDLCEGSDDRMSVIVRFLALLELLKSGAVSLEQAQRFGDIHATWTGEVDVESAVVEADEYSLDARGNL
ncbi:MAG: segregation and condensation protein [Actinomycetota bacterium]|nr:segregation and condensation protein [Actinomycetota bacterium]